MGLLHWLGGIGLVILGLVLLIGGIGAGFVYSSNEFIIAGTGFIILLVGVYYTRHA